MQRAILLGAIQDSEDDAGLPLPVRERMKVRVLMQRAIFLGRDSGFCLCQPLRDSPPSHYGKGLGLHASFTTPEALLSLCHSERSEESRIFLDAGKFRLH